MQVDKPRLRKKRPRADEPGEVEIPAYTALQADQPLADRMLEVVLQGVSTRKYETVLPALADQVGVSKSEVSRETIEAGTRVLKEMAERDLSELDVLVVYLDGIVFGDYHVLAAVGVDAEGRKHVLGLCGGASENTEVTAGLLEDLVARGLRSDRRRLFVIDGAKALRAAIGRVFGSSNLVQRCRNHKVRNVLGHLPKAQHEQARSTLRAAWKLDADEGIRKLEQYASWLEREWPSVAAGEEPGPDLGPVGLQVIAQLVDGHAVDAGRPLVAPDTRQRLLQVAGLDDRLHRRLLPGRRAFGFGTRRAGFGPLGVGAPGFTLRRRLQGQLQLDVLPPGPHERCRPTDPVRRSGLRRRAGYYALC